MIKTIIVEDEIMAQKSLEKLCSKFPTLSLEGTYDNAADALEKINEANIELIFLDIEMPGMTGIELLERLPYLPQVVFTTGNKEYAYIAFEYDITDFLKKPISFERFEKSVNKVIKTKERRNEVALTSSQHEIYIKSDGKLVRLDYKDIHYFENVGDYVKAVTSHGNYVFHETLKALNKKINNPRFLRIHRSYIVNMSQIIDIEDNTLIIDKKVIPVSRAYKGVLMKSINLI